MKRCDACLKLITHLCEFGRSHNISLVAEGVETSAMFKTLTGAGVPYLQGIVFTSLVRLMCG
nr:EAL domain-containing protein [Vibrio navarrensis]